MGKTIQPSKFTDWIDKPENFNKELFEIEIRDYFLRTNGILEVADELMIKSLIWSIGVFCECMIDVNQNGLTTTYNGNKTIGANPHITIADKTLKNILQMLRDLRMTQKTKGSSHKQDGVDYTELLAGSPK